MGKPEEHAKSSVKLFGGKEKDYLPIHEFIDSSRAAYGDLRHRVFTHNSWFINTVVPAVFGKTFKNSAGKRVSVIRVAEFHVLEDYGQGDYAKGFIPSPGDFLDQVPFQNWMDNGAGGEVAPSHKELKAWRAKKNVLVVTAKPKRKNSRTRIKLSPGALEELLQVASRAGTSSGRGCGSSGALD
jgi:hypothetical protein